MMAQYIHEKIEVLKQFKIKLTPDETAYMNGLKTEIAVDNFARTLMQRKLRCI